MEPKKPEKKYALGPDGRIVDYDPHHHVLKPGWREAMEGDIAALIAKQRGDRVDAAVEQDDIEIVSE